LYQSGVLQISLRNLNGPELKNLISRQSLLKLLDSHFATYLDDDTYEVSHLEPVDLITSNRLDLAIKILYLQMKNFDGVTFAKEIYSDHIKAFSLGSFCEPGNDEKIGIQKFFADFDRCFQSIEKDGIDESISVIPLSAGGSIANGSHRVASAYVSCKTVPVVSLPVPDDRYDADFFLERGMSQQSVEIAVTKFIEYASNCYVAMIWPSASGRESEIQNIIPNVVYSSSISLNHIGAHNLISQIYYGEPWLGQRKDNYPGARNKLVECFSTSDPLRVIAFQAGSLEQVQSIKARIREVFAIGKHSIHISDTKDEAIRIARLLFNRNSIHFLNSSNPNKYSSSIERIECFKRFLDKNNVSANRVVVDSSHILSLYGLRESKDIDFLAMDDCTEFHDDLIQDHSDEIYFHQESKGELIFNGKFHFHYEDLKFISFDQLYRMKKNRSEEKDKNDLIMMDALIENSPIKNYLGRLKQRFYYLKAKLKMQLIAVLRTVGLYRVARYFYRLVKNQDR